MSLPPALMARLAQRGLMNKQKQAENNLSASNIAENEEVIAEDYDEMEAEEEPPQYDKVKTKPKPVEENFWLERMKARMGEGVSSVGYKGCPNKYNIWHKCTLYCLNRWAEGLSEPSRDYMRRYKRLLRKYPLPKGWIEMYDPGCGCYYFLNTADNMVSWLPPTHPQSQISKSAAVYRRQMDEATGDSDGEQHLDREDVQDSAQARHHREIDEIINSTMRTHSPQNFPGLQESTTLLGNNNSNNMRKQKSRDLERTLSRQRRNYGRHTGSSSNSRRHGHSDADVADPMDPSSYSDIPRGKWSDGLTEDRSERKKSTLSAENSSRNRGGATQSDHEDDDDDERDYR